MERTHRLIEAVELETAAIRGEPQDPVPASLPVGENVARAAARSWSTDREVHPRER